MRTVTDRITLQELEQMAVGDFGQFVKAVVDVRRGVMVVDAELHADQEMLLLDEGSEQSDLWGINPLPQEEGEAFVEFDSMINLRPSQGNRSRGVDDPETRAKIIALVNRLVER